MIEPNALLRHAEQFADTGRGHPTDTDLRRGISAAYYAVFHDVTGHAANHLVGSSPLEIQNEIRRSWSHGEISQLAEYVVDRAEVLQHAPDAALPRQLEALPRDVLSLGGGRQRNPIRARSLDRGFPEALVTLACHARPAMTPPVGVEEIESERVELERLLLEVFRARVNEQPLQDDDEREERLRSVQNRIGDLLDSGARSSTTTALTA